MHKFQKGLPVQAGFAPIQIILSILAGTIILGGIVGGVLYFAKQPNRQIEQGKCGDGACDAAEKANPNLCPRDCAGEQPISDVNPTTSIPISDVNPTTSIPKTENIVSVKTAPAESPFGIFFPYSIVVDKTTSISKTNINDYLKDIGVKWVEEMPIGSDIEDISKYVPGIYSRIGISVEKTKVVVEKHKDMVKYWEIGTEPNGSAMEAVGVVAGWKDNPSGYVEFLKEQYDAMKEKCSDCHFVPGGLVGVGTGFTKDSTGAVWFKNVLAAGGAKYYEAFEFKQHAWNANEYKELKNKMDVYGKIFSDYGVDIKKIPVFLETATHSGDLSSFAENEINQSEATQAVGLIKIYVYGTVQGIDKILWNLMVERHDFGGKGRGGSFDHYGLVNNPDNDGDSSKKLAYYTYKKMVEILDGSDWDNIQTIQEKDGIYVYKFIKNNKPIWVAWNDNSGSKQVTISSITSSQVKITEAVPKYESGKDVADFNTAFNSETKTASGGKITITLDDVPVFVE